MDNAKNGLLKFIACGSVDDGKSTLIGHILYSSGAIQNMPYQGRFAIIHAAAGDEFQKPVFCIVH
ncbi:hypothetical protein R83H12_02800 [Fibrobacteria bacterium R8-3-H12]